MKPRGTNDPTAGYRAGRGLLLLMAIATVVVLAVVLTSAAPAAGDWIAGSVAALHQAWLDMHWSLV